MSISELPSVTRRVQNQQYLLQGSILEESRESLMTKLKSICDNSHQEPKTFREREIVLTKKDLNSDNPIELRVRYSLDAPDEPWTLLYLGNPELSDRDRPTLVRTYIEVSCTTNVCTFLQEMGFKTEFDFYVEGISFRKGRIKTTVSKLHRITDASHLETAVPISDSRLIEVSGVSYLGHDQVANDVVNFADSLKPIAHLEKVDYSKLV